MNTIPRPPALPLVTVVTVVRNLIQAGRETTFRQCVESVHDQDYPAIEHLIIDGASTDGTQELARSYEAQGMAACVSEPDKGIYDAMNKGIALAHGKYIAFLNSDDLWHDASGVRRTVELLELSQADFSYAPTRLIRQDGSFCGYMRPHIGSFLLKCPFCHQTMLTRTDLMRRMGGFDHESLSMAADHDLITRMLLRGAKPVFIPHCFTSYRQGGESDNPQTARQEILTIHQRRYAGLIGEEEAAQLHTGRMPAVLYRILEDLLHPVAFKRLQESVLIAGKYVYMTQGISYAPSEESAVLQPPGLKKRCRVLGVLPIEIQYAKNRSQTTCCGIPLLVSDIRPFQADRFRRTWKLFGLLPIMTSSLAGAYTTKYYLFGFIPLLAIRRS